MKRKNTAFKVGARVQWSWMGRKVKGTVQKIYTKPVSKILREFEFKRNGSDENPAYLIRTMAGSDVLKGHTELERA
jgi:hypothetical protein